MPSRYPEPFGLVAGEALWSGLPVILGETALMAEEIRARGAGLACDARDEAALAGAMRTVLDDDVAARRMSVNAFAGTRDLGMTPEAWHAALAAAYAGRVGVYPQMNADERSERVVSHVQTSADDGIGPGVFR
jgi:glycosyltransferase involved in cell wall biosynthesis